MAILVAGVYGLVPWYHEVRSRKASRGGANSEAIWTSKRQVSHLKMISVE